jgi:hypothetical protein
MNKSIITAVFAIVFAVVAVGSVAPAAEAKCSYNGWENSKGKCSVSWDKPKYNNYNYYNSSYNGYSSQNAYLEAYIKQLQQLLRQLMAQQGYDDDYDNDADVSVSTRSASSIDDDSVTLRGTIDFDGEDEATVFFQYGKTQNFGNSTAMIVIEEDEDEEDFTSGVTGLSDNTLYYFRAVAEDEDGDRDYGNTLSFRTDDDNNDDDEDEDDDNNDEEPNVETEDADDITDRAAELSGEVDMNDFNNGVVFFAYGEDEDQVEDVADDFESYNDVEEDGDNLQVTLVDGDLDGQDDYAADITGLDRDTEIFYALCVAYEDEDDDEVIVCGDTESFTTDVD